MACVICNSRSDSDICQSCEEGLAAWEQRVTEQEQED